MKRKQYANKKIRFIIKTCRDIADSKHIKTRSDYYAGLESAFSAVYNALENNNFKQLHYYLKSEWE